MSSCVRGTNRRCGGQAATPVEWPSIDNASTCSAHLVQSGHIAKVERRIEINQSGGYRCG